MSYPALPDHRIPYDNDGTLVYLGDSVAGAGTAMTDPQKQELQDEDIVAVASTAVSPSDATMFVFFPEQREITGCFVLGTGEPGTQISSIKGSNDTTNGLDGTWETASLPGGVPAYVDAFSWRSGIKAVSFTGPKKNLRIARTLASFQGWSWTICHLYGEAAAGQMLHDLVFLDPDLGAGVAFPVPEDFGDQPLGTTVVRPFRVKNTSATKTATNINLQCNDADFTIGESISGPWVATIGIASLAFGAESATLYTKCTTPAPGAALKPRFARIVATCDPGFFG